MDKSLKKKSKTTPGKGKGKEVSVKDLPFEIKMLVLGKFFLTSMSDTTTTTTTTTKKKRKRKRKRSVVEYYGEFREQIYQVFRSFSVDTRGQFAYLPLSETLHVEYWGEQIPLPKGLSTKLNMCVRVEAFVFLSTYDLLKISLDRNVKGVDPKPPMVKKCEDAGECTDPLVCSPRIPVSRNKAFEDFFAIELKKISGKRIEKLFFFGLNEQTENNLRVLDRNKSLKELSFFGGECKSIKCFTDLFLPKLTFFYMDRMPTCVSFSGMKNLVKVCIAHSHVTELQMKNILALKYLKDVVFCCCDWINGGFVKLFNNPKMEEITIKDTAFDLSALDQVDIPAKSRLIHVGMEGCLEKRVPKKFVKEISEATLLTYVNFFRCNIDNLFGFLKDGGEFLGKEVKIDIDEKHFGSNTKYLQEICQKKTNLVFENFEKPEMNVKCFCDL